MSAPAPGPVARDALLPFVFEHANVRGAIVRLDATRRAILASHDYPPPIARALAELLAASALLAASLQLDGSVIVQLSGDGPVRLVVVECNDALEMRATAQWDAGRVAALGAGASLAELAGGSRGRLTLSLDPRNGGALYQGIVGLEPTSIAASIEHYLDASEQVQSRIWLHDGDDAVHGMLLQRLPGQDAASEAAWTRITTEAAARIDAAWPEVLPADALHAVFPHDDLRLFDVRPAAFRCKCSVARVANALRIAGRDEVEAALAERGAVEVTCEFCSRRYTFAPDEARALVAGAAPGGVATGIVR